jgi:mannose-6-phosphate isomerase-like protein (cupin superfamily)
MLKNRQNTTRVEWSAGCFSWQLIDDKKVSIKMEEIYPGGRSDTHFHTKSIQFFFILEGEASFSLEDTQFDLKKHDGLEIPLNKKHQIINSGENNLIFLLISFPPVQEDDIRV